MALLHCSGMEQVLTKSQRGFASDNNAGVHPEILEAIVARQPGTRAGLRRRPDYPRPPLGNLKSIWATGSRCSLPSMVPERECAWAAGIEPAVSRCFVQ